MKYAVTRIQPLSQPQRLRVALIAVVSLALWTAESCPGGPMIQIATPRAEIEETFHPLLIEIDFWAFANHSTLEVLLNGVDITDDFELEYVAPRTVGTAVDVFGSGVVLEGENTLIARINGKEDVVVFEVVGDPHADAVASFTPGAGAGYGQPELPGVVVGPPQGLGLFLGGLDVLSLGQGGVVELEFVDNVILDGPGVDFTVFENAFFTIVLGFVGDPFSEPGRVSVSQDGLTWHVFDACETAPLEPPLHPGCAGVFPSLSDALDPLTPHPSIPTETPVQDLVGVAQGSLVVPEGSGGDSFDLADLGLTWARYVRIEDIGPALGQSGTVGFDLDGVSAVNSGGTTDADGNGVPDAAE